MIVDQSQESLSEQELAEVFIAALQRVPPSVRRRSRPRSRPRASYPCSTIFPSLPPAAKRS
jgi:hypothetical protein